MVSDTTRLPLDPFVAPGAPWMHALTPLESTAITPSTAQRTFQMLGHPTRWVTAQHVHDVLAQRGLNHAVARGHRSLPARFSTDTVDVDLLIRPGDAAAVRAVLESQNGVWHADQQEFVVPSGVTLPFVLAGSEGQGLSSLVRDPADPRVT